MGSEGWKVCEALYWFRGMNPDSKRRKNWLLIWGSLFLLFLIWGGYNGIQIERLEKKLDKNVQTLLEQSQVLPNPGKVLSPQAGKELHRKTLEQQTRLYRNQRARLFIIILFAISGFMTIVSYRRLKKAQREINPHSLIDEIGNKP